MFRFVKNGENLVLFVELALSLTFVNKGSYMNELKQMM